MARDVSVVLSHWYHLMEGLQESPQQFYASIETALENRKLPDTHRSRVDYREGGILSARREYLRIQYKEYLFDICAAPFGKGFFVSWWLAEAPGCLGLLLSFIPFLRPRITYFRLDSALMFQESVHLAVLEVIDTITKAQGLRVLSEFERKPTLSSLFKK